jgi:predicted nuclease with TOPRIM domain
MADKRSFDRCIDNISFNEVRDEFNELWDQSLQLEAERDSLKEEVESLKEQLEEQEKLINGEFGMRKKDHYNDVGPGETHCEKGDPMKEQTYMAPQLHTAQHLLALSGHNLEYAIQTLQIVAHLG